jgi:hypothetical protein
MEIHAGAAAEPFGAARAIRAKILSRPRTKW